MIQEAIETSVLEYRAYVEMQLLTSARRDPHPDPGRPRGVFGLEAGQCGGSSGCRRPQRGRLWSA